MWIIDRAYTDEGKIICTNIQSRGFDPKEFANLEKMRFRIRDDDDIVYFEGFVSAEPGSDILAPLDDYGLACGAPWLDVYVETLDNHTVLQRFKKQYSAMIVSSSVEVWEQVNG